MSVGADERKIDLNNLGKIQFEKARNETEIFFGLVKAGQKNWSKFMTQRQSI